MGVKVNSMLLILPRHPIILWTLMPTSEGELGEPPFPSTQVWSANTLRSGPEDGPNYEEIGCHYISEIGRPCSNGGDLDESEISHGEAAPARQGRVGIDVGAEPSRAGSGSELLNSGRSSPLSTLQEDWLREQTPLFFMSDEEEDADGGGYSPYQRSEGRADEDRPLQRKTCRRPRAAAANNSKYSTAAAWVQAHMLEEPVCNACLEEAGQGGEDDGLSLQEMAAHIRDLGVPDALASPKLATEGSQPWEEALSGGAAPQTR
jgi:hypothetical protein